LDKEESPAYAKLRRKVGKLEGLIGEMRSSQALALERLTVLEKALS
jgi:hypothetical protein